MPCAGLGWWPIQPCFPCLALCMLQTGSSSPSPRHHWTQAGEIMDGLHWKTFLCRYTGAQEAVDLYSLGRLHPEDALGHLESEVWLCLGVLYPSSRLIMPTLMQWAAELHIHWLHLCKQSLTVSLQTTPGYGRQADTPVPPVPKSTEPTQANRTGCVGVNNIL